MKFSRFLISLSLALVALIASAVPAKRGLFPVTQPDGSVLMVQRVGDEWSHFTLTEDRQILTFNPNDGGYYYSRLTADGDLVATDILATAPANRTAAAKSVMTSLDDIDVTAIKERRDTRRRDTASSASRAADQSGMGRFTGNFPRTGNVRGLVILAQYKDVKFTHPAPTQYFGDMLMKDGFNEYGGTGSAHDYFISNSGGLFDPQFDVYGPVTLSHNREYYGGNDSRGDDQRAAEMVAESCRLLDSKINFADYDMDADGYVDNVFVFYAGQGEASYGPEESIWPHQWELRGAGISLTLDGKKINKYACSNEWEKSSPDGVGTFIHEFSHVMGLPDLYRTDNVEDYTTPGEWSVLDYGPYNNGGRTPPNYSMFERNAMGWVDPVVLGGSANIDLPNLADSNKGCLIPTRKSTEFFLLENRQNTGWDRYLPGHGLVIWHIDFVQSIWDENAVNNTRNHHYVRIVPANNSTDDPTGWTWPGTSGNTSFTSRTTPALKSWDGRAVNVPITDIVEAASHISYAVDGGVSFPAPVATAPSSITPDGFTATWEPVDGATDYLLTVTPCSNATPVDPNYDGGTLPAGWSKNFSDTYTTSGNYGASSPSLKFSKTDAALTTPVFPGDITKISFWYKGMTTDENSHLKISGLIGTDFVALDELYPEANESSTYATTAIPTGVRQVRFTYSKSRGNMAVDDIVITYTDTPVTPLKGYSDRSTGGLTSCLVDTRGLSATKFEYTVKATDGTTVSRASAPVEVDLADVAGVDDVTADATMQAEYYNLQGIRVSHPTRGLYIVRRGTTVSKVIFP